MQLGGGGVTGWLIRAQQPRRERISCKRQRVSVYRRVAYLAAAVCAVARFAAAVLGAG